MSRAGAAIQTAATSKKTGSASTFPLTPSKGSVAVTGFNPVWAAGGTSVSLTTVKGTVTTQGKVPGISTAAAGNLGTPILADAINTGLVLFIGGAPSGSTQAGKEQISGNALQFVNGNFTRADPDFSDWVIPQTTNLTGVIHVVRPTNWNTTVTARYAVWADVIIDQADNYSVLLSIPWNDGWAAPFVVMGSSRIGTGASSNITYTPAGTLITINGPDPSNPTWPSTGRHTIGHVRDGDTVLWFLDGAQVGGSTTGAGTAAPLWTGGSGQTQKTICFFGRNSTSVGNGLQGGLAQLRIWGGTSMPSATQMITNMTNLHNDRTIGRVVSSAQALEPVNSSATAVTMTVDSAPKQTMVCWGFGLGQPQAWGNTPTGWHDNALPVYIRDAAQLYTNLGTTLLRLNSFIKNPSSVVVDAVNNRGVDHVHVTYYEWPVNGNIAQEAKDLVDKLEVALATPDPLPVTSISLLGEPGAGGKPDWPPAGTDPADTSMTTVRTELNNRGHSNIELFPPEFASADGNSIAWTNKVIAGGTNAINAMRAAATHSYNMGPGPDWYDDTLIAVNKNIWQFELGNGTWDSVASRVLSNLNNGSATETWHQGHASNDGTPPDTLGGSQRLVLDDGSTQPWYTAWRLAAQAFPRGTIMRTVTSNWNNFGVQSDGTTRSLDPRCASRGWYTYGTKPAILYCSGKRPDGTFRLAVYNSTHGTDFFEGTESLQPWPGTPAQNVGWQFSGHFHAQTIQVIVTFSELANVNGNWTGFRGISNGSTTTVSYPLVGGQLRMTLAPQDMIVLGGTTTAPPPALLAVNDTAPFVLGTGDHVVTVLANDTYSGTPTVSITSQSTANFGTTDGTTITLHTSLAGLAAGTQTVTYSLTATGNTGSSSATLTSVLTAQVAWTWPAAPAWIASTIYTPAAGAWDFLTTPMDAVSDGTTCWLHYLGGTQSSAAFDFIYRLGLAAFTITTGHPALGSNWTRQNTGGPAATFLTNGQTYPEEGYFNSGTWRQVTATPAWTTMFGGAIRSSGTGETTQVAINLYQQTSNDGLTWSPNTAAGNATPLVTANASGWAGSGSQNDEFYPGDIWFNESTQRWHILYVTDNATALNNFSIYHAYSSTAALSSLAGANSLLLLAMANTGVTGTDAVAAKIVDHGAGVVDVLITATDYDAWQFYVVQLPITQNANHTWTAGTPSTIYRFGTGVTNGIGNITNADLVLNHQGWCIAGRPTKHGNFLVWPMVFGLGPTTGYGGPQVRLMTAPISTTQIFSEIWTGGDGTAWGAQWTTAVQALSTITIQTNAGRMLAQSAAGGPFFSVAHALSSLTNMADFDMTFTFTLASGTTEQYHGIFFRASTTYTASVFHPTAGYELEIGFDTAGYMALYKYTSDAIVTPALQRIARTWNTTLYNVRILAIGNLIKAKMWQGAETSVWDLEVTDATYASGALSLSVGNGAVATARSALYDTLTVRSF